MPSVDRFLGQAFEIWRFLTLKAIAQNGNEHPLV